MFVPARVTVRMKGLKKAGSVVPAATIARAATVTASYLTIVEGSLLHCRLAARRAQEVGRLLVAELDERRGQPN